jgi:hypothetical protein
VRDRRRARRAAWAVELEPILTGLREAAEHPHAAGPRRPVALVEHGGFTELDHRRVPFVHATDRDGMIAYVASMSFVGILPPARRAQVLGEVAAILDRNGVDTIDVPYDAELWITRRRPGPAPPPGRAAAGS